MTTVQDVIDKMEILAPPHMAASWDNVGLLVGDRKAMVQKILTCLTLTEEVATEAATTQAQMVITHHPILFRGAKRLTTDSAEGRTILKLAGAGIAVYSSHTCFDDGPGGINDQITSLLGMSNIRPLRSKA